MRFPHRIRKKSIANDRKSLSAKLKGQKSNLNKNWHQKVMKNCLYSLYYSHISRKLVNLLKNQLYLFHLGQQSIQNLA